MKHTLKLLLGMTASLGFLSAGHAATLTQAQITWIVKDVRTIEPSKGARPAVLKETIQGEQALRTGIASRTELFFNDHTITRLGANTHFSFTEGTRNISLENGVMLLQVPKGIGGAEIKMAAVTAGITGTTIMLETMKPYTKLIVLDGECCLWKNGSHHKVCAKAGQEILFLTGSKEIPQPFYINLKVLEFTSKLTTGKWGVPLNQGPLIAALNAQGANFTTAGPSGVGGTAITQQLIPQSTPPPQKNAPPPVVVVPQAAPTPPPVNRIVP